MAFCGGHHPKQGGRGRQTREAPWSPRFGGKVSVASWGQGGQWHGVGLERTCHGQKHKGKVGPAVWRRKIRNLGWETPTNLSMEMSRGRCTPGLVLRDGSQDKHVPSSSKRGFSREMAILQVSAVLTLHTVCVCGTLSREERVPQTFRNVFFLGSCMVSTCLNVGVHCPKEA